MTAAAASLAVALLLCQDGPPDMSPAQRLSEPVCYVGAKLLDRDFWDTPDRDYDDRAECPVCGEVPVWVLGDVRDDDASPWVLISGFWDYRSNAHRETCYADGCGHEWRVRLDGGVSAMGWRYYDEP